MPDEPHEPAELNVRTVIVWCRNPDSWELEIDIPEWMSPYEAYGMLARGIARLRKELDDMNTEEEEEPDER